MAEQIMRKEKKARRKADIAADIYAAELARHDVFDTVLGPIKPDIPPWQLRRVSAGAEMGFGSLLLTPEGAECVNQLRSACAARNIPVPKALMLILRHYLQSQNGA